MINCDSFFENLSAYLDGELSDADKTAFEEHAGNCRSCSAELDVMKAIMVTVGDLDEELPEGFEASLHKRLEEAKIEAETKKHKLAQIRMFSQIAAGFVLVIALGLVIRSGLFNQKSADNSLSGTSAAPAEPESALMQAREFQTTDTSEDGNDVRVTFSTPKLSAPDDAAADTEPQSAFIAGTGKMNEEVLITEAPPEKGIPLKFSEDLLREKVEGHDTVVTIQVEDINKALDTIMAIEKKLKGDADKNMRNLQDTKVMLGTASDRPVEVELFYTNDELWQEFLGQMQGVFPEMQVQSEEALEEQEYIRVVIQKSEEGE